MVAHRNLKHHTGCKEDIRVENVVCSRSGWECLSQQDSSTFRKAWVDFSASCQNVEYDLLGPRWVMCITNKFSRDTDSKAP